MTQLIVQPGAAPGIDTVIKHNGLLDLNNFGTTSRVNLGTDYSNKAFVFVRGLFRFDLSSIPITATIDHASLTLFAAGQGQATEDPAAFVFAAYPLSQTGWTELGANWQKYDGVNAWNSLGGPLGGGGDYLTANGDTAIPADIDTNLQFDNLAAMVADAVSHRQGQLDMIVIGPETPDELSCLSVYLSDYSDATKRPRVVVDYTMHAPAHASMSGGMHELSGNMRG